MQDMTFMDLCMLNIEYIHIYFNLFTDILTILGLEKSSIPIILTGISGHFSKVCIPFLVISLSNVIHIANHLYCIIK